jgi:hypothetical protein
LLQKNRHLLVISIIIQTLGLRDNNITLQVQQSAFHQIAGHFNNSETDPLCVQPYKCSGASASAPFRHVFRYKTIIQQICNDAGGCHGCQIKRCRKAGAGLPIRFQQTADNTGTITLVRIGKAEILKILHSNSSHIIILNNIIQK